MFGKKVVNLLGCAVLGLCLAGASDLFAQGPGGGGAPGGGMRGGGMNFEDLDTNGDGKITADEFQGPAQFLERLDTDGDGAVTAAEMETAMEGMRGQRGAMQGGDMTTRMLDRMQGQLGIESEDDWAVIRPRLQAVMEAQAKVRPQQAAMGGRGGRGGRGGAPAAEAANVLPEATALNTALENEEATADQISAALEAYREARAKAQEELKTAQQELVQLLSKRQEALLVTMGYLD